MCLVAVLGSVALGGLVQGAGAQAAPPAGAQAGGPPKGPGGPPPGDPLGPDLYFAIRDGRVDQVEDLLNKGAKTEARNWLGLTPLLWAVSRGDDKVCAALIKHKADVNCDSIYGGTLEFAAMGPNTKVVKLLLDNGARFSEKRSDKITALMGAADGGHVDTLRLLLERKPDVNAADLYGMTALTHASRRGHLKAAQVLIEAGAMVDSADTAGRTPLMYAALNGYPDVVRLLISHGAKVNARDKAGDSALILAARHGGEPAVASALLKAGADASVRDAKGRSSSEIALKRGFAACAAAIDPRAHSATMAGGMSIAERSRKAAQLSLPLIERTTRNFSEHSGCASCHHQGLGLMTTGTAASLGYTIDRALFKSEQKVVLGDAEAGIEGLRQLIPHPEQYKHFVAVDMSELNPEAGTTLTGLASHNVPRSEAIDAIATIFIRQQAADGSYKYGFERAPIQSSEFTFTALAARVMNAYTPRGLENEWKERRQKAQAWLVATPGKTNEDLAFRLLGLKWAGAPKAEIDKAVEDLRRTQRRDGGWAQFSGVSPVGAGYSRSDAYATGESLYALHIGGDVKPSDAAYQRGVTYLLNTQEDDGSWFVNKRAVFANNYFDTGFPHGESQFISYGATCWSTMALMFAAGSDGKTVAGR
jgi:ankyrin repeat protein